MIQTALRSHKIGEWYYCCSSRSQWIFCLPGWLKTHGTFISRMASIVTWHAWQSHEEVLLVYRNVYCLPISEM
jgi:hypothetical protein